MPTTVKVTIEFEKDAKRLKRKYPAISAELRALVTTLESDERLGDKIPNVGHDVYKVRLKNPSANRGKRGGFRVIYYVQMADTITLLTVYAKTEQADIDVNDLKRIIQNVLSSDEQEHDT